MTEYFCPSSGKAADGVRLPSARDPKLRDDLEVAAMTYIRMKEEWRGLGQKFSKGMYFYLNQGDEFARKTKAGGARSLLGVCNNWFTIPDDHELNIPS